MANVDHAVGLGVLTDGLMHSSILVKNKLNMSTHRKIEWALFVIGLIGFSVSMLFDSSVVEKVLFGVVTLFAGLHVFHLYDGHKSNHVVVAGSLAVVIYTAYVTVITPPNEYIANTNIVLGLVLSTLSLRLRKDFHKN